MRSANQNVEENIIIQVTLAGWDSTLPHIKSFFQESKFAQFQCGLTSAGPIPEPQPDSALSINLRVDRSLEPKWFVVKGRNEGEEIERKPIYAAERAMIGLSVDREH